MALFIIILLVLAAAAGVLGTVVKVALGVALGLVVGFVAIASLLTWRIRRAISGGRGGPRWRRVGNSRVEVLEPPDRR